MSKAKRSPAQIAASKRNLEKARAARVAKAKGDLIPAKTRNRSFLANEEQRRFDSSVKRVKAQAGRTAAEEYQAKVRRAAEKRGLSYGETQTFTMKQIEDLLAGRKIRKY